MRTTKKGGGRKRESARLGLTHGEEKIKPERRDAGTGFKYYMKRQTRQEGMDGVVTGRLAISLARATRPARGKSDGAQTKQPKEWGGALTKQPPQ